MKTLCVIDMQPGFGNSYGALEGCLKLIDVAKKRRHHIILVEYKGEGRTQQEILDKLRRYKNYSVVKKNKNDGSWHIFRHLGKNNIKPREITICGVNTRYCVYETARGLINKLNKSKVIVNLSACNDDRTKEEQRKFLKDYAIAIKE